MSSRAKSALVELEEREAALRAALVRVREIETAQTDARTEVERLREAAVEAFSGGHDSDGERLAEDRRRAEDAIAGPWAERVRGAKRAADRARLARDVFIVENHARLVGERRKGAVAITRSIETHLRGFVDDVKKWHAEEAAQLALLQPIPGRDSREIPGLGAFDTLARDIRRLLDSPIPLPLPSGRTATTAESRATNDACDEARAA